MKSLYFAILFFIFLTPLVLSAEVVQVQQDQQPQEKGFFGNMWAFIKSPVFWGIMVFIIIATLIIIGLVYLIAWFFRLIKSQNDIYFKIKKERISLAKAHSRYSSNHWWRITKNTPIHLVRVGDNGKPYITRPIGYHRGDYTTHEGNEVIAMSIEGRKKFWFWPDIELLIIPDKEKIELETHDEKGNKQVITVTGLPRANQIVQYNENQILIYADSLSSTARFLVPVLKTDNGKIIDLSLPVYNALKEVAINDYLYQQSDSFVKASRKAVDMNPSIRGAQKLTDSNQGVDVNTQEDNV